MNEKFNFENANESVNFIKSFFKREKFPETVIILGSGLGNVIENMKDKVTLDSSSIPYFPKYTAPGHAGKFIIGRLGNHEVIILQGRVHYYECHSMSKVTFHVRVLRMLGVKNYIATNASGAINRNFKSGELIAVRDHINLMGDNPLIGENEARWNERFPDMSYAYNPEFLKIFQDLGLKTGVYIAFSGPSFETPSEIKAAIVANSMGMKVAALSCVANKAAGIDEDRLSGQEVLEVVKTFSDKITNVIIDFLDILEPERKY